MTEATKWTAGEWTSDDERPEIWASDGYAIAEVYDWCLRRDFDGKSHPATTPGATIDRPREEVLANARLIAASPDMAEALRVAERTLRAVAESTAWAGPIAPVKKRDTDDESVRDERINMLLAAAESAADKARAALAKAGVS